PGARSNRSEPVRFIRLRIPAPDRPAARTRRRRGLPRPLPRGAQPRLGSGADRPVSAIERRSREVKAFALALPEALLATGLGATSVLAPSPAAAQLAVFDGTNYAQNLLQAARALNQINNQLKSLQNEASMLQNMATNLKTISFPQ